MNWNKPQDNPLIKAMVGKNADQISNELRHTAIAFAIILCLLTVLVSAIVIIGNDLALLTEGGTGLPSAPEVALYIVGVTVIVALIIGAGLGGFYPVVLGVVSVLFMRRQIEQLDWYTLIKLTGISDRVRINSLVFAAFYQVRVLNAFFLALPLAAALTRLILLDYIVFSPSPVLAVSLHTLAYVLSLLGLYVLVLLIATASALSFDDAVTPVLTTLAGSLVATLAVQIGIFAVSRPFAFVWMLLPYGLVYVVYGFIVRIS